MNFRKIINQLPITFPISLLAFLFVDLIMGNVVGGISSSLGLPFPYWHCVFVPNLTASGDVSYFSPLFLVVDIILFVLITAIIYSLNSNKKVDIKKLNRFSLFKIIVFNILVLFIFFRHIMPIVLNPIC